MAYNFNGSGNYLSGSTSVFNGSSQLTISAWMWLNAVSTSNDSLDFGAFAANPGSSATLLWYNSVGNTANNCFSFNVGNTSTLNSRIDSAHNAGNSALQQWCHVVGTMNGASRRIYVNGSLSNNRTNAAQSTVQNFSEAFRIGGWTGSGNFAGDNDKLADIGLWNRELSDDEIYGLSRGLTCDHAPRNLILYFPLLRDFKNIASSLAVSLTGSLSVYDPHPRLSGMRSH